jgi:hypothetical protein
MKIFTHCIATALLLTAVMTVNAVVLSVSVSAQSLSETPMPNPTPKVDAFEYSALVLDTTILALDAVSTRGFLSNHCGTEMYAPAWVVNHSAVIYTASAASSVGEYLAIFLLTRHHHQKLAHMVAAGTLGYASFEGILVANNFKIMGCRN